MKMLTYIVLFLFTPTYCLDNSNLMTFSQFFAKKKDFNSLSELGHRCLRTNQSKNEPTPELNLEQRCKPYRGKSCCRSSTADKIHKAYLYEVPNKDCKDPAPLSDGCRQHFESQLCFHHCSPDIGPWILKDFPNRFAKAPLCKKDCDAWFEACENDFGCFIGWNFGHTGKHLWTNCTENHCLKFKDMYSSAKELCEKVWDQSWKVVDNERRCLTTNYNPEDQRNRNVMRNEMYRLSLTISNDHFPAELFLMLFFSFVLFFIFIFIAYWYAVLKKGAIPNDGEDEIELTSVNRTVTESAAEVVEQWAC